MTNCIRTATPRREKKGHQPRGVTARGKKKKSYRPPGKKDISNSVKVASLPCKNATAILELAEQRSVGRKGQVERLARRRGRESTQIANTVNSLLYLIYAWAVVESENKDTREYFYISNFQSHRDKGPQSAEDVLVTALSNHQMSLAMTMCWQLSAAPQRRHCADTNHLWAPRPRENLLEGQCTLT